MCVCWEVLRVIYSKKRIFILDVLFYFVVLYHIKIFYQLVAIGGSFTFKADLACSVSPLCPI